MRHIIGGCVVAAALVTSPAHGANYTDFFDDFLYFYEQEVKKNEKQYFTGYLDGLVDGIMNSQSQSNVDLFCPPEQLNVSRDIAFQGYKIGLENLKANVEVLRNIEERSIPQKAVIPFMVVDGLRTLFPCK